MIKEMKVKIKKVINKKTEKRKNKDFFLLRNKDQVKIKIESSVFNQIFLKKNFLHCQFI